MEIKKTDVIWNYLATFLKISSSVILFPFILKMMSTEIVGIWTIFVTITALAALLDFGFSSSFTRNITYIFSGVSNLKKNGYENLSNKLFVIDFGLLKGVIEAMKWFYLRVAVFLFIIYSTFGTYYVYSLLKGYSGDKTEVYVSWGILCIVMSYNLYTLYFEALLIGRGLIKRAKQISIIGNLLYLIIAVCLILFGYGLIALVSAQAISVILVRFLSYKIFYTNEIKQKLIKVKPRSLKEILNLISPNAIKIGLTSLGGFMVNKSAIVIGSLYISLGDIATYGISMQLIGVIGSLAGIYISTYQSKIAQLRILHNLKEIKKIYLDSQAVILVTYFFCGIIIYFFGDWLFEFIGSQTHLMPKSLIFTALIVSFLEVNHSIAGNMLLSKNEVPFFKASLSSGTCTILFLLFLLNFKDFGILSLIIAPGIIQGIYQNWKWPLEVIKELDIKLSDLLFSVFRFFK